MIKDKMYVIVWRDHFSTSGWIDKEKPKTHPDFLLTTVGFYVKSDKNYHHFAMTSGDYSYGDIMSILKNQIVDMYEIEYEDTPS